MMSDNFFFTPNQDAFVSSYYPTENFGKNLALFVGKFMSSTIYNTLIKFDLSGFPSDYKINKAILSLYIFRNDQPSTSKVYNVYRNLNDFNEDTVNYNNQPSTPSTPLTSVTINNEVNTFVNIDITSLVQNWYKSIYPNYGLKLKAINSTIQSLVAFYSKDSDESYPPRLQIFFEPPVQIASRKFESKLEKNLATSDISKYSKTYDVSTVFTYTYFVINMGTTNPCNVAIQISPDGSNWIDDSIVFTVNPNEMIKIVPKTFSCYSRLRYISSSSGNHTNLDLCLQTQA